MKCHKIERVICVGSKRDFFFPKEKDYVVTAGEALPGIKDYIPEHDPKPIICACTL